MLFLFAGYMVSILYGKHFLQIYANKLKRNVSQNKQTCKVVNTTIHKIGVLPPPKEE